MKNLRELVERFGKPAINSATKYPSILTYHKVDGRGGLLPEFTTDLGDGPLYATEKIDGCNGRIIFYKGEFLVGSREDVLGYSPDLYFNPALDMVETLDKLLPMRALAANIRTLSLEDDDCLLVVYGELYGGKTTAHSKQYGRDANGFRVFDVVRFFHGDLEHVLSAPLPQISLWREKEDDNGIVCGQSFFDVTRLESFCRMHNLEQVPIVPFTFNGTSHQEVMDSMRTALPKTMAALTESALLRPEGLVVRTHSRHRIVKLRFEDYEKTLRVR